MAINIRAGAVGGQAGSSGVSPWSLSQFAPGTAAFWTLVLFVLLLVAVLAVSGAAF